jgi:hypothetical protein
MDDNEYNDLQDFMNQMNQVEKEWEIEIPPEYRGRSRALFKWGSDKYFMESGLPGTRKPKFSGELTPAQRFFGIFSEPTTAYWTDFATEGKEDAEKIAEYYGAETWETPYPPEGKDGQIFHYWFDGEDAWERLMKLAYDRTTGEYQKQFNTVEAV